MYRHFQGDLDTHNFGSVGVLLYFYIITSNIFLYILETFGISKIYIL